MTQRQSQVNLLTIKEFANICRTTPRTIRFYEMRGLLKPKKVDEWTKYRYYAASQARDFLQIRLLQNFHVTLREIPKALRKKSAEPYLETRLENVHEEIEERHKEYLFLQSIKNVFYAKAPKKLFQHEVFGPYTLLCIHLKHGRYDQIDTTIQLLKETARKYKIPCADKQITIYEDPLHYSPNSAPLEIGIICNEDFDVAQLDPKRVAKIPSNVYFKTFKKTKALTYNYKGPFPYLHFIHFKILEFMNGKKLTGLPFDLYTYGPWNKKSEYDHEAKVGYPV